MGGEEGDDEVHHCYEQHTDAVLLFEELFRALSEGVGTSAIFYPSYISSFFWEGVMDS